MSSILSNFLYNKGMEPSFDEILKEFLLINNLTQTTFANAIGVKAKSSKRVAKR